MSHSQLLKNYLSSLNSLLVLVPVVNLSLFSSRPLAVHVVRSNLNPPSLTHLLEVFHHLIPRGHNRRRCGPVEFVGLVWDLQLEFHTETEHSKLVNEGRRTKRTKKSVKMKKKKKMKVKILWENKPKACIHIYAKGMQ